jgi:hypothetical protein
VITGTIEHRVTAHAEKTGGLAAFEFRERHEQGKGQDNDHCDRAHVLSSSRFKRSAYLKPMGVE